MGAIIKMRTRTRWILSKSSWVTDSVVGTQEVMWAYSGPHPGLEHH